MRLSITVRAPLDRAWAAGFATQDAWRRWLGHGITVDVRTGGAFAMPSDEAMPLAPFAATLREVAAPTHAVLALRGATADGPVVLTFALSPSGAGTRVELEYQGWEALPEPGRSAQLRAFRERLAVLARVLERDEGD
jgi:hypothetical protein